MSTIQVQQICGGKYNNEKAVVVKNQSRGSERRMPGVKPADKLDIYGDTTGTKLFRPNNLYLQQYHY